MQTGVKKVLMTVLLNIDFRFSWKLGYEVNEVISITFEPKSSNYGRRKSTYIFPFSFAVLGWYMKMVCLLKLQLIGGALTCKAQKFI